MRKRRRRKGGGRPPKGDYLENFTDAIVSGFKAMAMILAYLMVFTIGINILEHLGVFSVINNQGVAASFKGIFEMTMLINLVGMCDMGIRLKSVIAAFLVSFGGLSVAGQSMSMARLGHRPCRHIKDKTDSRHDRRNYHYYPHTYCGNIRT